MKTPLSVFAFAIFTLSLLNVRADFIPNFGAAPYAMDQTVIGVDGWEYRLPDREQNTPDMARVVQLANNGLKPGLELKNVNLRNVSFPPATGDKITVSFSLALEVPKGKPLGRSFRLWFGSVPLGEIYFEEGEAGGFGYGAENDGRTGGTLCIPQADVSDNNFYTFTLEIHSTQLTYDLTVTGEKADGSPLNFKATAVPFLGPMKKEAVVDSISIISSPRVNSFLGSLAIESK